LKEIENEIYKILPGRKKYLETVINVEKRKYLKNLEYKLERAGEYLEKLKNPPRTNLKLPPIPKSTGSGSGRSSPDKSQFLREQIQKAEKRVNEARENFEKLKHSYREAKSKVGPLNQQFERLLREAEDYATGKRDLI